MRATSNIALVILCYISGPLHTAFSSSSGSEYGIHRTACRREASFKLTDQGKKLAGGANNIIQQRKEATLSGCVMRCLQNDSCITINYKELHQGSAATENCQLLDIGRANGSMVESTGWNHYEPVKQVGPKCRSVTCGPGLKCHETCANQQGYECVDIDECLSKPCLNGGTCSNLANAYTCQCPPGTTGTNCATDTNECESNPCKNGGTCNDDINKYSCKCATGYAGTHCETIVYSSCEKLYNAGHQTQGIHTIYDANSLPYDVYCESGTDVKWTLIARFSNADSKGWANSSGEYWYDTLELGSTTSPSDNSDMINKAFYNVKGSAFKITRSDDSNHRYLLYTNGCFSQKTFREVITSYGDFRNDQRWNPGNDSCRFSCPTTYGTVSGVAGFAYYACPSGSSSTTSFWCHYQQGGGAVIMNGGGGTSCGGADHGIAITKSDSPRFGKNFSRLDFGDAADGTPVTSYALNLWIR